jgi:hypothetical protein
VRSGGHCHSNAATKKLRDPIVGFCDSTQQVNVQKTTKCHDAIMDHLDVAPFVEAQAIKKQGAGISEAVILPQMYLTERA